MAQKEVELHIEKEKTVVHQQTALAKSVILELFTSDNTVIDVPFRPKGGSLYVVKTNEKSKNDWKADGYAWTNQGSKSLPRKDPKYRKSYFYIKDKDGKPNAGFRKDVFFPLAQDTAQQICIVHYIGNEELSAPAAHGNAKVQTKLFFRTKPSVVENLTKEVEHHKAHKVYKELICQNTEGHDAVAKPRNVKQLQNARAKVQNDIRLSKGHHSQHARACVCTPEFYLAHYHASGFDSNFVENRR